MNMIERAILAVAPEWAQRRARARAVTAHYDAATVGRRAGALRADRTDADAAGRARARVSFYARDMVRNTPFATRGQAVIARGVVGDGIIPKITVTDPELNEVTRKKIQKRGLKRVEQLFDTTAIDRQGRCTLYGLQDLVVKAMVADGEVLVRIHPGGDAPGSLPLQLDVLEIDFLDTSKIDVKRADGSFTRDGITYDAEGRRLGYWLYPEHPGADWLPGRMTGISEFVPADEVWHIYRLDRPGQQRGVSWFAPVMQRLQDLADHEDAQLMRQKIAACFAAFRVPGPDGRKQEPGAADPAPLEEMAPGLVYDLEEGEDIKFSAPPAVEGYDEFTRSVLRSVAAGLGVTYEALTADLAQVNFSSARMGRLEMDANISAWQWHILVPQFLQPLAARFLEAWEAVDAAEMRNEGLPEDLWDHVALSWVPPRRVIVDPAREFAAMKDAMRNGLASRQQLVRQMGSDPERLLEEIIADRDEADRYGLVFDSDPRMPTAGAPAPARPAAPPETDGDDQDGE